MSTISLTLLAQAEGQVSGRSRDGVLYAIGRNRDNQELLIGMVTAYAESATFSVTDFLKIGRGNI
jgi:hypothetical protein